MWLGCHQNASTSGGTGTGKASIRRSPCWVHSAANRSGRAATRGLPVTMNGTAAKSWTLAAMVGSNPMLARWRMTDDRAP